ncbi:Sphingomyelin phosphodiesterase 4 [Geodia barretti]|uniref:Sphingomyelin phosphodiesterase 4 n=1 Tax=Geodia barretti TaxID=519541 RepID=A0AA35X6A0_GEOBA|nr:Sphingomyelin phosphodiesterase 4 [Geodia barretti]
MDLTSDPGIVLLYRVTKVFTQPGLMDYIIMISSPPKLSPTDSSPQWHQTTPPSLSPLRLAYSTTAAAGHTPFSEAPKSLEPEYVRGTAQLTPRGKMQLIQGSRKSSNLKVPYLGDPLLQPVRSYENTTLVRVLHSCSLYLNERFARQLQSIGVSNSFLGRVAKQFLSPPLSPPFTHSPSTSNIPRTPKSKVTRVLTTPHSPSLSTASPRFNLRPLASYYTISCVSVGLSLLWLLLLPLWFILVIMLVLLGAVPCACGRGPHRKTI